MSKTPTREAETQALAPVSRGQIVKAGELAETGSTTATGEIDGRVPPSHGLAPASAFLPRNSA
jgi:hypothetical protein